MHKFFILRGSRQWFSCSAVLGLAGETIFNVDNCAAVDSASLAVSQVFCFALNAKPGKRLTILMLAIILLYCGKSERTSLSFSGVPGSGSAVQQSLA